MYQLFLLIAILASNYNSSSLGIEIECKTKVKDRVDMKEREVRDDEAYRTYIFKYLFNFYSHEKLLIIKNS